LGNFKKGGKLKGKIEANKGVFFFVVEGKVALEGKRLGKRDALALSGPGNWEATCTEKSQVLVIDVPLSF
ncbi:MAG: pirin family protein, partial [Nanoarchaeota archaeon]|nr:pirin family protein [Nanoarchaeota archaeon]